jgi:hypothetical protein
MIPLTPALFVAASFLAAFLLFLVQPMVGKMVLPRFGGVPAVWNTCQLFFQFALLAGYAYAHLSVARFGVRRQIVVHAAVLLLPLLSLPIALPAETNWSGEGSPIPPLLGLMALTVGVPFFVVSATAPLLQRWYAESGGPSAADPYFLYAASNIGSMAALVGYPLVVEPNLTLAQQGRLWAIGFGVLAVLIAACGLAVRAVRREPLPVAQANAAAPPVAWPTRLYWIALAFVPSSLLLGVTTYITTDIAPVPLLWVVPLALYLLSFVLVFLKLPDAVRVGFNWLMPVVLIPTLATNYGPWAKLLAANCGPWASLSLHLLFFFSAAMVLHGELVRRRPPATQLTEFYLCMSIGGVLGGFANAVLAPLLLNGFYEYGAAMVLACLLMPSPLRLAGNLLPRGLALGVAVVLIWLAMLAASRVEVLHRSRNFFGVLTVTNQRDEKARLDIHRLVHGTTEHGVQFFHDDRPTRRAPRAYFFLTGPIGQVFVSNAKRGWNPPVAVVGLGAGSLASYAAEGQDFKFFEIDPDVVKVAEDRKLFTFLAECPTRPKIVLGDARLTIAREPSRHYGLVIIDAFSSDAIPIHLLTAEAIDIYLDKLADDGMIAFHVSNNYLNLERVLDGHARNRGLVGLSQTDDALTKEEVLRWKRASQWVVLARNPEAIRHLAANNRWKPLPLAADSPVWTDDYSSILGVLQLGGN